LFIVLFIHLFTYLFSSKIAAEVQTKLKEVDLLKYENMKSINFSGGMKRRLSVAICSIGDPKIIYLDGKYV
jgi:ABC-type multidrug transport system ATPase subunit